MLLRSLPIPRPFRLPAEIGEHDFVELARAELDGRVRLRLLALVHLAEGKRPGEVAGMLTVHEKTVMKWLRRLARGGVAGLQEQPGWGAKRRLPSSEEGAFKVAVLEAQASRRGGRITGYEIRQLLAERFGVYYSLSGVYTLLERIGLAWVSSRSKHPRQDPEAQVAFKKTLPRR
jgi:Transposase and inactivated derivatives